MFALLTREEDTDVADTKNLCAQIPIDVYKRQVEDRHTGLQDRQFCFAVLFLQIPLLSVRGEDLGEVLERIGIHLDTALSLIHI